MHIWVSQTGLEKNADPTTLSRSNWAMKKGPAFVGIRINHHKDPYQTTSISWESIRGLYFFGSTVRPKKEHVLDVLFCSPKILRQLDVNHIAVAHMGSSG